MVGMERMPKRAPRFCSFSVFTFAKRALRTNSCAARSKFGAIILHGPHHGAQKSTIIGMSLLATTSSKLLSLSSIGFVSKSDCLHLPQLAFL